MNELGMRSFFVILLLHYISNLSAGLETNKKNDCKKVDCAKSNSVKKIPKERPSQKQVDDSNSSKKNPTNEPKKLFPENSLESSYIKDLKSIHKDFTKKDQIETIKNNFESLKNENKD
jgi:LAS superfamily LD-carboxypeptidase LdcB